MGLRLFFRLMLRQKVAWILNVLCLSVAFAVLFIVIKQVKYDFSFDTCYPEHENVYQLGYYNVASGKHEAYLAAPIIRQALSAVPEVSDYTFLWCSMDESSSFYCGETEYPNIPYYGVYPGFIQVFQPRILAGDAEEALKVRNGLVIPESLAKKWFGREDPIGKSVGFGRKDNLWPIKAVYEDFPENSSMRNAVILKMKEENRWSEWSYYGFFRTYKETDKEALEKKIIQTMDSTYLANFGGESTFSKNTVLEVNPMQDVYFTQDIFNKHGNLAITLCLLAIGILIIVVAYINFINFSTALAPSRSGTLNICKIAGASGAILRRSILCEAIFLSVFAWGISFFWVEAFSTTALAKTYFNASLDPVINSGLFLLLGGGALVLGVLTGMYPAYYMTSFQPALVLKGSFALSGSGRRLRNGLLLFQFVVTIVLVIASLFVVVQHRYLRDLPWGYDMENVVYTRTTGTIEKSRETFRSELMKNPNVLDVTASRYLPGEGTMGWGDSMDTVRLQFAAWPVASNFLTFFGIPVYEGDTLREPPAGKDYMILNRRMVEKFGLQKAMGRELSCFSNMGTIIGFAENVNFVSLHNEIEPMAFVCGDDMWNNFIFIKIRPEKVPETIRYIKECMSKFGNEHAEITFLDNYIDNLYRQEENLSRLISLFCLITVIISLAGIYGLILFNIRYKVKEIGIRKIHGSTSEQILWRLNGIFIRLVIGGAIVAIPLAYLLVNGWLSSYPYRTPIHWWIFLVACLITLLITLATVSRQSWKAANANPVDAVKTE